MSPLSELLHNVLLCAPRWADRAATRRGIVSLTDGLTPTPFKKRVATQILSVRPSSVLPVQLPSVCLMLGDVAMATLVNAFYSLLPLSLSIVPFDNQSQIFSAAAVVRPRVRLVFRSFGRPL